MLMLPQRSHNHLKLLKINKITEIQLLKAKRTIITEIQSNKIKEITISDSPLMKKRIQPQQPKMIVKEQVKIELHDNEYEQNNDLNLKLIKTKLQ